MAQPFHHLVFTCILPFTFFVFPVRGDTFFCYPVLLIGANLYFEMIAVVADHRRMDRWITILTRDGDVIFDPVLKRTPVLVHYTECVIAIPLFLRDNSHRRQIIDLVERDRLSLEFEVDTVKSLDPPF